MKFLIIVSSVLAAALATWEPVQKKYHGPLHYPVIHKGVPVEPAEVQHARDSHLEAFSQASQHGYGHQDNDNSEYNHEEEVQKWHGPLHYPVIHMGVPVEPTEVQHASAAHLRAVSGSIHHDNFANHGKSEEYDHSVEHQNHDNVHHYSHHEIPKISHDGKPLDTHEVEAAKAKHFAAVHEAIARNSHGIDHHYRNRRGAESYVHFSNIVDHVVPVLHEHHEDSHSSQYDHDNNKYQHGEEEVKKWHGPLHYPIIHKGVPVETPEVQHARAAHLNAFSNSGHQEYDHHKDDDSLGNAHQQQVYGYFEKRDSHGYSTHQVHAPIYGHIEDHHHQYTPIIGHNGTPINTPEVQHAREAHFAAYAAAIAKHY